MTPVDQARRYLDAVPPAVAGNAGHNQTWAVAMVLVEGFALGREDATMLMREYSARCQPPWSESEIEHKIDDAIARMDNVKRGDKLSKFHSKQPIHRAVKVAAPVKYDLPADVQLPQRITCGALALLHKAFKPGEGVRIAIARTGDDGREVPKNAGNTLPVEDWIAKLETSGGDPNKFLSTAERNGIFISINPMKPGGSKDSDVTDYRHALLEFDAIPATEQWAVIQASGVPCTAVISSGVKSIHAWVRVDAKDKVDYAVKVDNLYKHFASYKPDEKNKNPSRFSRLPGCERGAARQELLALNAGQGSFDEWLQKVAPEPESEFSLPPMDNAEDMLHDALNLPDEVICGVLHKKSKGIFGGSSKSSKTWMLVDLALSVSNGMPFWQWPTVQGRVLMLNFEIDKAHMGKRIRTVAEKKEMPNLDGITVWNLRGKSKALGLLLPELKASIFPDEYSLIIIDPQYKMLGGRDENSAGDIGELCNEMEELAIHANAALVYGAHYSKGNQASKNAMDRISGSGAFARDADSIITLTQHREEGCFAVECTLRNHPPQAPFVVRWEWPIMRVAAGLDARQLKQPTPKQEKHPKRPELDLLEALEDTTKDKPMTAEACAEAVKKSVPTVKRYKGKLRKDGLVATSGEGPHAQVYITDKGLAKLNEL